MKLKNYDLITIRFNETMVYSRLVKNQSKIIGHLINNMYTYKR